jgi:hypothetical protein
MSSSRLLCAWLALGALGGCQFFARDGGHETNRPFLTPLQSSKDAIRLDVLLIDRRVDDPLIGPLLWREVDQVGAVSTEARELLLQNGYVVGHAAAKPPQTLLKLLGVVTEFEGLEDALQPQVTGRTYSIRSGTETEIQTSQWWPECELTVHDGGTSRSLQFRQARCVLKMKPLRLQDGWVRVEFVPEIHHGEFQLRRMPTDVGWALKSAQNVESCYPQRFAVTLNVGESAVISAAPRSEGTMGDRFFRREQEGETRQRLLVVRLADMGRTVKPVD